MKLPRITIVTPSFNQAPFLEQTIVSVLDQHYPDLQFGIIDGGSTDGSIDILHRYRDRLSFTLIEPDQGQSDAINKGLARADGDIVGWLNSDDTLLPGALRTVGGHFARHHACDWLIGRCRQTDAEGRLVSILAPEGQFTLAGALLRPRGFSVPQPSTFWRRSLMNRAGLLDVRLHHCMDFELWCRFLALGVTPDLIDDALSTYRLHPSSKTCAQADRFIAALIDIEKQYAHHLPWRARWQLYRHIGYQTRALALRRGGGLWRDILRRPWWLASQQVRAALRQPTAA